MMDALVSYSISTTLNVICQSSVNIQATVNKLDLVSIYNFNPITSLIEDILNFNISLTITDLILTEVILTENIVSYSLANQFFVSSTC